jgi:asparagine synthase (glutamine-hydrolysing)
MPGIVGIIRPEPYEGIQRDLGLMAETMRHETYYVGNQYVNRGMGLYMGWLSHPCSLGESMPLISADKQVILIMVGESYSDNGRPISPEATGVGRANAHRLLHLYEESEDEFLASLNGWFCGVIINLGTRKITLFNDRYGMNRIYFYEGEDEFIFASEAKSLLRVRPTLRAIEPGALAEFLRFNCVMGNKSLFKGVSLLPPGSSWVFAENAVPEKKSYFDFTAWEEQPVLKPDEFYEKFDETVSRVFPRYLVGSSRVALSLTSGLDTRVILAAAGDEKRELPCYTFGGLWGDTFDIRRARELAAICSQPHEVIRISEQFLHEFSSYAEKSVYISDGTHDAFGAHDVFFNQIARKIAPIRLTGKFGSEVVRTRRMIPSGDFPRHLVQNWLVPFLDEAPLFDQISQKIHPLTRVVSEEIPWYEFGRVAVEQSQVVLRTPYMDNELVKLMYRAPHVLRSSRGLQVGYLKRKTPELANLPTNMGRMTNDGQLMGKVTYGLFWALFKAEYIYLFPTPHWLTRVDRKLEKLKLERIIVGRQKFEAYRIWIKTHLAESIRDTLLDPRAQCTDFFDKASVRRVVDRHTAGTHNYLNEINKMLTIELICSSLLRSPSTSPATLMAPCPAEVSDY